VDGMSNSTSLIELPASRRSFSHAARKVVCDWDVGGVAFLPGLRRRRAQR